MTRLTQIRLKNRDPTHWRDAWQMEHMLGKYILSETPMSEEQWIKERASTIALHLLRP
jgi:hypothetical protein